MAKEEIAKKDQEILNLEGQLKEAEQILVSNFHLVHLNYRENKLKHYFVCRLKLCSKPRRNSKPRSKPMMVSII